jgi:biotin carboxylase
MTSSRSGPRRVATATCPAPAIIEAALGTGADAVHPGYGFLSEDPYFAKICAENGLTFIGPPPEVMVELSDKSRAQALMAAAGVPVLGGSDGAWTAPRTPPWWPPESGCRSSSRRSPAAAGCALPRPAHCLPPLPANFC